MSIAYSPASDDTEPNISAGEPLLISYEQFVTKLIKEMGSEQLNKIHMVLGIAGEAGEIVDAIKKENVYGKPLDRVNVVEELGDLEFYIAGLRQMYGIRRDEVLANNVAKLMVRYPTGYTDEAAIARADKDPTLPVIDPGLIAADGTPLPSSYLQVIDVTAADYLANPPDPRSEFNAELNNVTQKALDTKGEEV